jgi:hypothetical protein
MKNPNLLRKVLCVAAAAATLALVATPQGADAKTSRVTYRVDVPGGTVMKFDTQPRWEPVPGTRVYMVRQDMRPDHDYFKYGNKYYVYSNGQWYRANRWNGRYITVNERQLPAQFYKVPQNEWRAYPNGWSERASVQSNTNYQHGHK